MHDGVSQIQQAAHCTDGAAGMYSRWRECLATAVTSVTKDEGPHVHVRPVVIALTIWTSRQGQGPGVTA